MVFRPDAEARPFRFALLPVLVGSSTLFTGYRLHFFSGCFDRVNRINRNSCELGFPLRIARILTDLGSGGFLAVVIGRIGRCGDV